MKASPHLISIIIPSFNQEKFIEETLDSVLSQTYENWECIIVDDGSTDDTISLIDGYVKKDHRFKIQKRSRASKGANTCRNIGLNLANGEYVIFLDSDDLLLPFCLQNRINIIQEFRDFDFWVFSAGNLQIDGKKSDFNKIENISNENQLYRFLRHDIPWTITGPIWAKKTIKKLGGFNELYPRFQDPELHTKALLYNLDYFNALNLNYDHLYRRGEPSVSIKNSENNLKGARLYITDIMGYTNERKDYYEISENMKYLYTHFLITHALYNKKIKYNDQYLLLYKKYNWFNKYQKFILKLQIYLKRFNLINKWPFVSISWRLHRLIK